MHHYCLALVVASLCGYCVQNPEELSQTTLYSYCSVMASAYVYYLMATLKKLRVKRSLTQFKLSDLPKEAQLKIE